MSTRTEAERAILQEIAESPVQKIKVGIFDIDGILRGKYLSKEKFLASVESGFGFCSVVFGWDSADVCYDNGMFTGWHTGYPDAMARIDLNTYRRIPWEGGLPFFLADFVDPSGAPLGVCPRQLLKRVLADAENAGYRALIGMEFEWFNFLETPGSWAAKGYRDPVPLTPGMFGYSLLRTTQNQPFFAALMDEMAAFRIPIEGLHTETGPGVYEAAILYTSALEAADRAALFKTSAKEIGSRFGIMPSFMAKVSASLPGCSGHCHQSLRGLDEKANLFFDASAPDAMSGLFRSYLAGQLLLLSEFLPFVAPTVNSYKRLVDGFWAPTKPTWGVDNRTVACRVLTGSPNATRLETRVPGADINPYLAIAACVGAGLYGIKHNLELTAEAVKGSAYTASDARRFPRTLDEATRALSQSAAAREVFGEVFVDHFVRTREWEWRQYQDSVTSWELQRYFEII